MPYDVGDYTEIETPAAPPPVKPGLNVERLNQLADVLQRVDSLNFNMKYSNACIAGWANRLWPPPTSRWGFPLLEDAQVALGLTYEQAHDLFMGQSTFLMFLLGRDAFEATPKQAARVVRHLARTGRVNWNAAWRR